MMKDDDFKLLRGFADGRTDGRTDIGDCRVAFATEKEVMKVVVNLVLRVVVNVMLRLVGGMIDFKLFVGFAL